MGAPLLVASSERGLCGLARHQLLTFGVLLAILVGPLLFAAFTGGRGRGWRVLGAAAVGGRR